MMRILCCIKQVPEVPPGFDKEKGRLRRDEVPLIINPFDLHALEEAVKIKEKVEAEVFVLSMGPKKAEEALRYTLSVGADEAVLLTDPMLSGSDTFTTSYALSCLIKERFSPFDLILCGKQAIDGDTAQVGPQLAQMLGLPVVCYVQKITLEDGAVIVERRLGVVKEKWRVPLPCLLTVTRQINKPRLPSLKNVLSARKKRIIFMSAKDIGIEPEKVGSLGSLTKVVDVSTLSVHREGKEIEGKSMQEKVKNLLSLIRRCKG
jgi:electron transfer flavoprotein beta subunit